MENEACERLVSQEAPVGRQFFRLNFWHLETRFYETRFFRYYDSTGKLKRVG